MPIVGNLNHLVYLKKEILGELILQFQSDPGCIRFSCLFHSFNSIKENINQLALSISKQLCRGLKSTHPSIDQLANLYSVILW